MVTTRRYVRDASRTARRLLSLVFPSDVAKSIYCEFGDIVAAARAQLSPDLVNRQAAAMDALHRTGVGNRLREMNLPVLIATGTADIVSRRPMR